MPNPLNPRARSLAVLASIFIGCVLLGALTVYQSELSRRLHTQKEMEVNAAGAQATEIFNKHVAVVDAAVSDLALFLAAFRVPDSEIEAKLASKLSRDRIGLDGVAVVQLVSGADRAKFEKDFLAGQPILAAGEHGFERSPPRDRYLVIRDVAATEGRYLPLGLDLLSEPRQAEAIQSAEDDHRLVHSAPIFPVRDRFGAAYCSLIICPVMVHSDVSPTTFAIAVFRIGEVASATNNGLSDCRVVEITDVTHPTKPVVVWKMKDPPAGSTIQRPRIDVNGRTMELAIKLRAEDVNSSNGRTLQVIVWVFGIATCVLSGFLVASLLFKRIQAEEHRRELQNLAAELLTEIAERKP